MLQQVECNQAECTHIMPVAESSSFDAALTQPSTSSCMNRPILNPMLTCTQRNEGNFASPCEFTWSLFALLFDTFAIFIGGILKS